MRNNNSASLKAVDEEGNTHILDLPEEIFRLVFTYLDDAEVYFKLRVVCHRIKEYAEKYIELGKKLSQEKVYY